TSGGGKVRERIMKIRVRLHAYNLSFLTALGVVPLAGCGGSTFSDDDGPGGGGSGGGSTGGSSAGGSAGSGGTYATGGNGGMGGGGGYAGSGGIIQGTGGTCPSGPFLCEQPTPYIHGGNFVQCST